VLKEFWESAPTSYKAVVFGAMGLIGVGIILNLVGNTTNNRDLAMASLAVIGLGLVLHIVGIVVRGQTIRKNLKR
jgi:predicted membrane channel-forming protein YqfA (hemolysin III family)